MSRIIYTNKGQEIIVDDKDYKELNKNCWYAHKAGNVYYTCRSVATTKKGKRTTITILMHRVIMDAKPGQQIDHINGNGLDNRSGNLRFCTNQENQRNARTRKDNTSTYKGVTLNRGTGKWRAQIKTDGNQRHIGNYPTPGEAARAYDRAAIERFGEFAKINFPPKGE